MTNTESSVGVPYTDQTGSSLEARVDPKIAAGVLPQISGLRPDAYRTLMADVLESNPSEVLALLVTRPDRFIAESRLSPEIGQNEAELLARYGDLVEAFSRYNPADLQARFPALTRQLPPLLEELQGLGADERRRVLGLIMTAEVFAASLLTPADLDSSGVDPSRAESAREAFMALDGLADLLRFPAFRRGSDGAQVIGAGGKPIDPAAEFRTLISAAGVRAGILGVPEAQGYLPKQAESQELNGGIRLSALQAESVRRAMIALTEVTGKPLPEEFRGVWDAVNKITGTAAAAISRQNLMTPVEMGKWADVTQTGGDETWRN